MRSDGTMVVENADGEVHKVSLGQVPVAMVYRDGKYMLKLPQTPLSCELLGKMFGGVVQFARLWFCGQ